MAETHRRVEPRGIVGTGMSTDPERIREIENRAARMERDYNLPGKKFGEVFENAPKGAPKDTEWVDAPPEKEKRKARGVSDPKGRAVEPKDGQEAKDGHAGREGTEGEGKGRDPKAPPSKPQRPSMGAANAAVGSKVGVRTRVAFKV